MEERFRAFRLYQFIQQNPEYAEKIGVEVKFVLKEPKEETCNVKK